MQINLEVIEIIRNFAAPFEEKGFKQVENQDVS
jgi:hypothetical protein